MHKIAGNEQINTTTTIHTLTHTELRIHANKHIRLYTKRFNWDVFFDMLYIMCTTSDFEVQDF
jgi:hypothetical protein